MGGGLKRVLEPCGYVFINIVIIKVIKIIVGYKWKIDSCYSTRVQVICILGIKVCAKIML